MPKRRPSTAFPKGNGAGKGDGWGGPARGASASRIRPGDPEGIQAMSNDADVKAEAARRADELRDHLYHLALNAERQETQLAASVAFLNRAEGMPVARHLTANVADPSQLSDADLAAIATAGRTAPVAAEGDPPELGGLVH